MEGWHLPQRTESKILSMPPIVLGAATKFHLNIYSMMRAHTPMNALLRTAIAALFGLMSLLHGPVMTFAKAGAAPQHHTMHASHASSHHHGMPQNDPQPVERDILPVCYAF